MSKEISVIFQKVLIYDYRFIIRELTNESEGKYLGDNRKVQNFFLCNRRRSSKI